MAIKLSSTRDAASSGIKLLVHGPAGAGKTRLCATTGAPTVIISAEGGLLSLREHNIPVIEVSSLADVHEAYQFVSTSHEGQQFEWVCLDSISEIGEVVLSSEKRASPDPRKAYGAMQDQMYELIRAFRDLKGRNVYFSAKQAKQKDEASGAILYGPSMPGQQLPQGLPYLFDEVFCLRVVADNDGNVQRWLQTSRDFQYEAKDRSGALQMWEAPDLAAIAAKIRSAVQPAAEAA
jgi:hypothetical protein